MSNEKEIFNYLYNLGCCKVCCLRYLCVRNSENYSKIDSYILEHNYLNESIPNDERIVKIQKPNPCIVCLGLLQQECINATIDQICDNDNVKCYDSDSFTCSVSYPACIQVREHGMRLDLEQKFPDFYTFDIAETQLNKTWKWILKDKLATKLNKTFENSETCNFFINVTMAYELDTEELSVLLKMQPNLFSTRRIQHRKFNGELYSRKGVQNALSLTKPAAFREFGTVPPVVPTNQLICNAIEYSHNSIYIAGRYSKFSRELSQTPWIIDGVKVMETSVQEILFEPIQAFLKIGADDLKFSSSGREDVDVRCLGRGRPFVIEYLNPRKTKITFAEMRKIEQEVNQSKLIQIKDLQLVNRAELFHIKSGEDSKTKEYVALCCSNKPITESMLNLLNNTAPLTLIQKTPIRVLHRRPLATRERTVHKIEVRLVPNEPKLFILSITTQAGTYVKEFVHGDFERTKPNVGSILDADVDILALDVTAINLDWPPEIYEQT